MLHSVGVLDDLRRYRELESVDNDIENYLLVTVAHHGWKEEGSWRGSMERGDGSKSDAERLQSGVVVVMEEV